MNQQVTISVLMGVHNPKEPLFSRAIQSILAQSFPHWELLIYDDGSSPAYWPLLQKAKKADARIHCLFGRKNRGLAYALNQCLLQAKGSYVARMDCDDWSHPERFKKQLAFLRAHPQYQWVGSNAELTDEKGVWGFQRMPERPKAQDFLFSSPYIHPSVLFLKKFLVENGGYNESSRFLLCEDYELFIRLHQNGGRGYNLQQPLLRYFENYQSYQRRTLRRGIREMKLRWDGFRKLHILNTAALPYVIKPLLTGTIPAPVHHSIHRRLKKNRAVMEKRYGK